jgi:predicted transcriptional regulator of viral defense system
VVIGVVKSFSEMLVELLKKTGVGGILTVKQIQEQLGSTSGYIGILINSCIERGFLERIEAGTYRVTNIPSK